MVGSNCNPMLEEAANVMDASQFCSIQSTEQDFTSHLHINPAEGMLYIGGYILFGSNTTVGNEFIPIILTDNCMPIIHNSSIEVVWQALVGTSLNNAADGADVKWCYSATQNAIGLNKASATELAGKRVYINGMIPIKFANYS